MKICFYPIKNDFNSYINNMQEIIKDLGISIYSVREIKEDRKLFKAISACHFNWYEDLTAKTFMKTISQIFKKIRTIMVLKVFNKKIIWTMHNKIPHESVNDKLSVFMLKFMALSADKIIVHSRESINILKELLPKKNIENKVFYVHHINYINNCRNIQASSKESLGIKESELVFIFFGSIKKYKNIEILVKAFSDLNLENSKLIIAGKPCNEEYKENLNELINGNKNIITVFKFLDEKELASLIELSNIAVLPYNKKSSLNSGSIIMAFSCRRTVIAPMIGTLKDMEDENFYYGYDYGISEDHYKALKEYMKKAYNDYMDNKNILNEKGEQAFSYMEKFYDYNTVKKELGNCYLGNNER